MIILHFALAGIGMFYLMRQLAASKQGALVSGIIFMLSGYLFSNHSQVPYLFSISWCPIVILYCVRYISTLSKKYLVVESCLLSVQFFAGAPEISLITVFLICCLIFFSKDIFNLSSKFKSLFLILSLFLLFSSIQLFPFYELKMQSIRADGLSYSEATTWSLGWYDLFQFFLPGHTGYYLNEKSYWLRQSYLSSLYLGIIPIFLGTIYFFSPDRKKAFLAALMVLSLILALGRYTPFYGFIHKIPIFNSIRYPVKFIMLFFFVISISAGFGFDILRICYDCQNKSRPKIAIYIFLSLSLIASIPFFVTIIAPDASYKLIDSLKNYLPNVEDSSANLFYIKRFLVFTSIFGFILLLFVYSKGKPIFSGIIIFLLFADLFLINFNQYRRVSWQFYTDKNRLVDCEFMSKTPPFKQIFFNTGCFQILFYNGY